MCQNWHLILLLFYVYYHHLVIISFFLLLEKIWKHSDLFHLVGMDNNTDFEAYKLLFHHYKHYNKPGN